MTHQNPHCPLCLSLNVHEHGVREHLIFHEHGTDEYLIFHEHGTDEYLIFHEHGTDEHLSVHGTGEHLNVHEHGASEQWLQQGAFYFCTQCQCVFKNPKDHLGLDAEKARYDLHNNSIEDPRYIQYLTKSWNGFIEAGMPFKSVLDYGCGPVKALEHILKDSPYEVQSWDKFYHTQPLSQNSFDVIFCQEVVEHFTEAHQDFTKLLQWVHQGSYLFLSTELYPQDLKSFKKWYYKNDPTHVIFYQKASFEFLAQKHDLRLLKVFGNNKIILQKL